MRFETISASAVTLHPSGGVVATAMAVPEEKLSLVDRAKLGERRAFLGLFEAHASRVHALSLQLVDDAATAEILTRDIFLEAYSNLHAIRDDAAFASWLHRRAVRVVFARYLKRGLVRS